MTRTKRKPVLPARAPDRGAIAVVAALVLIVLMGMVALVVDGGYLAMRRRAIQHVADAAALAGAVALPTSATAISDARANATTNGYTNGSNGVTVTVNSPYSSSTRQIEVIVQASVPTFLGKALKINSGTIYGRAVAKVDPAPEAIFAGSNDCAGFGLRVNGSQITINGAMHSNSFLGIYGNNTDTFGTTSYVCSQSINGGPNISSGPTATSSRSYPISYTMADFPCTKSVPSGNFDLCNDAAVWQSGNCWGGGGVLKPGVYCAPGGNLTLNGSNLSGNVTLVSNGQIQVSGNNMNLSAYSNGVALYTTSNVLTSATAPIMMGVSTMQLTGTIYAPNGHMNLSGSDWTINGSLIGYEIEFGTSNWTVNSTAGASTPYLSE